MISASPGSTPDVGRIGVCVSRAPTRANGTGVHASSVQGTALAVLEKVSFSRSGVAVVPAGHRSVGVSLAGVVSTSLILATLQQSQAGVAVAAAAPGANSFTIYLTKAPKGSSLNVGWFVIG